jgi:HK97 family phage prohead protease/HK97 family phage major capsid protein
MNKDKVLYLNSAFTLKEHPSNSDELNSVYIEGYASTNDIDRVGDVIPPLVWKRGMDNYLRNPIILAFHDHNDPIGRMIEHKVDTKGLWIKARISAAAEYFSLIKDGVITAFSVGFRVKDAAFDAASEVFTVKELELIEISVVSVPANQNTLFSLSKAFDDADDYMQFKKQFAPEGESAKGLESTKEAKSETKKEWNMDPKELQDMLAATAKQAAEAATKSILEAQAAKEAQEKAAQAAQAELDGKIKSAVEASIKTVDTGAEKLLEEVTKRLEEQSAESKSVLAGLEAAIKEKADELAKIQASKMQFGDKAKSDSTYGERESAVLLSKISNKSIDQTKFGRSVIEKAGAHLPSDTWELEVSNMMEAEIRQRLVVAPIMRNVTMQTNVMTLPVNPEAGDATWVTNAQFGTTNSPGAAQTHALNEITLNAYKVATREYLNYEEEEDSLIALLPVIRDAMVRRVSRAVDKAFLLGAGTGGDPVQGLAVYDAASAVSVAANASVAISDLRDMRRDLGIWGLNPAELVYVVSQDVYYDLLDDQNFQTMDKVGSQATLLTGQVGSIGNTPVVVSGSFEAKADGEVGAIIVAPGNFLVGNQRGLRFDTQELVETQRRVLVASLRTGLTQITTAQGQGVSALRYTAAV